jgi:hypothetical protein
MKLRIFEYIPKCNRRFPWLKYVLSTIVLGASFVGVQCRHAIIRQYQLLYAQWQCVHYADSRVDVPVFIRDVANRNQLIDDHGHESFPIAERWKGLLVAHPDLKVYGSGTVEAYRAGRVASCWSSYASLAQFSVRSPAIIAGAPEGQVFLGRLQSPGGNRRLVAVLACTGSTRSYRGTTLEVCVIRPTATFGSPTVQRIQLRNDIVASSITSKYTPEVTNDSALSLLFDCSLVVLYPGAISEDGTSFRTKLTLGASFFNDPAIIEEHGLLVGELIDDNTVSFRLEGFEKIRKYFDVDLPTYLHSSERSGSPWQKTMKRGTMNRGTESDFESAETEFAPAPVPTPATGKSKGPES